MRVVIVAESALAAEAVRRGLQYAPNFVVVGYVDGRRPCAETVAEAGADLVVVDDMSLPQRALERVAEIRGATPAAKIVLLTGSMETAWLAQACEAGINAAVDRSVGAASLGTLVRQIAGGAVFHAFTPAPAAAPSAVFDGLTARELQILRLAASGASNGRIAAELWVTEQTVKFHLSNIYRKLGVANRTQAGHYAHVNGLLGPALAPTPDQPAPSVLAA
jgi:DNA-binding NarL/FixJ family response regulator